MENPVNFSIRHLVDGLARRLWPACCLCCGLPGDGDADRDLCPACFAALPWNHHACRRCALPLPANGIDRICGACQQRGSASALAETHASFRYDAPLDRLLPRFKFHQSLAAGRLLSSLMSHALADIAAASPSACVLPIPLHRRRLAERGYDQALELAKPLARRLGLPLRRELLQRQKPTRAQSQLDKQARLRNLRHAFAASTTQPMPAHIVLIDDVMTTGATLEAAAKALHRAGATRIDARVCARVV